MIKTLPRFFKTHLLRKLEANSVLMPIAAADVDLIKDYLGDSGYTFLNLVSPGGGEVVRVKVVEGQLAWERGFDNTTPMTFPQGSCLEVGYNAEIVKSLICEHNCCETDCPCNAVALAGVTIEPASVGQDWQATAIFTGDTPMAIAHSSAPPWCSVVIGSNYIRFSGKPPAPALYSIAVSATNCAGALANGLVQFQVT